MLEAPRVPTDQNVQHQIFKDPSNSRDQPQMEQKPETSEEDNLRIIVRQFCVISQTDIIRYANL